jgi:glycine oxidase
MRPSPDILILGGGVIGLTTAYFLAREGLQVEILDKGAFGAEASWAGAGILPPGNPAAAGSPFDRLRAYSAALFPTLSAELSERTRIDNGYLRCGGLEFRAADDQVAEEEWHGAGIIREGLDDTALAQLEPGVRPGLGPVWHLPDMAQLRNPRHLQALQAACVAVGVLLRPACPAYQLVWQGRSITAVETVFGRRTAGQYLLATGAWTEPLLAQVGRSVGIRPIRGQIALLRTEALPVRKILLWGAKYIVPRPDGRVLVGATEEDVGFDRRTTVQAIADLLALAGRLVPALAQAELERCWAGLRPGSPDGLPVLGRVPEFDNLFIAAGHFRAGIQLSPGTALVMKELLLHQPLTIPLEPFSIERFRGSPI